MVVNVLLDFYNVVNDAAATVSSVTFIVDKLLSSVLKEEEACEFNVRLYGGWDEASYNDGSEDASGGKFVLSSCAADVIRRLGNEPSSRYKTKHRIRISLARSLFSFPKLNYVGTYRPKQLSYKLVLSSKDSFCCAAAREHYDFLKTAVSKRRCHHCRAPIRFLKSSEQKIVDTLMSMDVLSFSKCVDDSVLVVVSDDDDFIPAIFQVVIDGRRIIHMRQRESHTYNRYLQDGGRVIPEFDKYYKVIYL